jgi:ribonuclease P protein subunit POP4
MLPTPETITRHELAGLPVRVVDADNPDLLGIEGRVVGETMRTLRIAAGASRAKVVPKVGTKFEFALEDEAADSRKASGSASELPSRDEGSEDVGYVTVDGATLLSRPALRTETAGDSKWR